LDIIFIRFEFINFHTGIKFEIEGGGGGGGGGGEGKVR